MSGTKVFGSLTNFFIAVAFRVVRSSVAHQVAATRSASTATATAPGSSDPMLRSPV